MPNTASIKLVLLALVGVLSGCATLLDEDTQEISVSLQCQERMVRAQCVAENSKGRWSFRAPGLVQVNNDYGDLNVTCKVQYMPQFTVSVPAVPTWNLAGNILLGGLIGAAYDIHNNTGLKYPETVSISTCN
ncbi:MAG: hypothetical protein RL659_425 [Pseudomonadota bacterium]|jgi:hypothetical protein